MKIKQRRLGNRLYGWEITLWKWGYIDFGWSGQWSEMMLGVHSSLHIRPNCVDERLNPCNYLFWGGITIAVLWFKLTITLHP